MTKNLPHKTTRITIFFKKLDTLNGKIRDGFPACGDVISFYILFYFVNSCFNAKISASFCFNLFFKFNNNLTERFASFAQSRNFVIVL